ncbi:Protein CBG25722 [Caenorhabditis briggsae]|uniref:Protein CBG25722 n=1 Tax=Caenorhabditis briggsae TaxID=6238 RepID=B6IGY5_CAEBR|nr:Protein CBG25722 [Caenorhabditis briggsae]CAR99165.1 Protein CBG25722 [Caenorhabditis briggsae]
MVSSRTFGSRRWADRQRRPADGSSSGPASGRAPKFCSSIPPPRLIIAPKLSTAPTGPTPEAVSASNVLWNRLNTEKRTSEPLLPTPTSKTPIQENFGFRGGYPEKCRRPELEKDEEWKFLYEKPLEDLAAPAPSKQPAKVLGPIIDLTGDSDDEEPSAEDEEALARIERRVREESRRLERRRRRAAADATSHKPE